MVGISLFSTTNTTDEWMEQPRSTYLSGSNCSSFIITGNGMDDDTDSIYTRRSSYTSQYTASTATSSRGVRTRTRTRSRSSRMSLQVWEEGDERGSLFRTEVEDVMQPHDSDLSSVDSATSKMFTDATIRVWKQTPLPNWMNVFVPRHVRLQTGPHPYLEYSRHTDGPIRQRVFLSSVTRLERLPKNKLTIEFSGESSNDERQSMAPVVGKKGDKNSTQSSPCRSKNSRVKWVLRFESKQERDQWAKKIQDAVDLLSWINKFTLGNVMVGTEASTLVECFSWLDQNEPSYVMKVMQTDSKKHNLHARNEIRLHHMLTNFSSHPNVLSLHDSFRQQERAYLVMEYCGGGDLFEHLSRDGAMDESKAMLLFRHIVAAIMYVHEQNIVHLDIKPENLLFKTSPEHPQSIKLADFGSAQLIPEASHPKTALSCTVGYAAPEVLEFGKVSFAADVFSAGAVLYTMLAGYAPFQSPSDEEAMERTLLGEFSFDGEAWDHVSVQAKDLICGMLDIDPAARMSMEEVLDHPWLQ
ncbi:hypothetical protein Poli38472_004301 [Pythium oligandrum]|uniref:Protein kinase domain-containing protein n=1 Tax=Pythium oligandrum TaxID=41045 RepID=A0A8K1CPV7_PYTOL|nr:hypothetical protein Poli38472_004301 [Pythium oligandrum]|eukprot:TMW66536.1 hypothetical protein Poli38472_004301 [Pythium oligandrum]